MQAGERSDALEQLFGERVRSLRSAAGLSQAAVAEALAQAGGPQLDPSGIARLERGQKRVALGEAVVLAQVLGTSVADMLGKIEPAPPPRQLATDLGLVERELIAALDRVRATLDRLRGVRGGLVGAQPMSEAEHQAAADQADEIESVGGEAEYRRLLDEQSED